MAVEEIKYTIPSDGTNSGSEVDIFLTYDESNPAPGPGVYSKYTVTAATGTYKTIDPNGVVTSHDIDSIAANGTLGADNLILLEGDQIVDGNGITFHVQGISGDDQNGNVNFFYGDDVNGAEGYQELGSNTNDATGVTYGAACYCTGTLILTERGEVPIERLAVGDKVVTASGAHRPVKWIGHRRIDCRTHPKPEAVWPYRIQASAFGRDLPHKDLWLSPDHCLAVRIRDDVLMTAQTLDNGCTVAQVPTDEVTYWHVELDSHDVLLANGLPAESYIESGNRNAFDNGGARSLHPRFEPVSRQGSCLPTVDEGAVVTAVRQRLRIRAEALGWALVERDADIYLLANGAVIRPEQDGDRLRFRVPAGVRCLILRSTTFVPRHCVIDASADRRPLGIAVRALTITGGQGDPRDIALDDPALGVGFHPLEGQSPSVYRWTDGQARLGRDLWEGRIGGFTLDLFPVNRSVQVWSPPKNAHAEMAA